MWTVDPRLPISRIALAIALYVFGSFAMGVPDAGFLEAGNVIRFGPVTSPGLPSPDGSRIRFDIPQLVPSRGEVPPMVLSAGDYPVSVTTPAGRAVR
jgi:hypothetical protein